MRSLTPFLLITLLASGCLVVPEGGADVGDTVFVNWIALDPDTGARLDGGSNLRVVVGSGESRLGYDFERQLIGHLPNETFRFTNDDPSRDYNERIVRPAELGRYDPVDTRDRAQVEAVTGPVAVGDVVPLGAYTVRIEAVTANQITYRYVVDGVQRDDISDVFGSYLLTYVEDGMLVQAIEPVPGARFTVVSGDPINLQFGLPIGSYEGVGTKGDDAVFGYTKVTRPVLLSTRVEFEVTIVRVIPAGPTPLSDNLGERHSPQLLADRANIAPLGITAAEDDGHQHQH